jgi:hypothetical protein
MLALASMDKSLCSSPLWRLTCKKIGIGVITKNDVGCLALSINAPQK